ncbi:MAG: hypothetical protein JW966_02695 [Anaerolineae bacterium]|nr:hypothetical protein [Anaerolineae bacterium]
MPDRGRVSKAEWRRVIVFGGLVMLITTLPYMVGWLAAGDGWTFGGFLFGADDGYSYLAKMRLGARGDWLFTIRYTSEPHDGALFFLPYILLGKLTVLFVGANNPDLMTGLAVTFHAARVVFGFLLILASYRFVAVFLRSPRARMLALILIALGGGLGWALSLVGLSDWLGSLPLDFYVPESYSFLILFGLPHLALARGAMLAGFLLLFRALHTPGPRSWLRDTLAAGVCWVVMGLCVPFYVAVLYVVLGGWGLAAWISRGRFPWALFWRVISAALVVLPVLLYSAAVFASSDVYRRWSAQNLLPSPHPLHYVFGYSVLAVPAVAALRWAWRKGASGERDRSADSLPYLLLAAWIVIVPLLVYLPINVQRRLAEGVIVPLSILAVAGLRLLFPHVRRYRRARTVILILVLPTAMLLWLGGMFGALTPDRPLFRPQAELTMLDRLDAIAPRDAVVLSSKKTGNVLPARTGLIAYVGHGPETIHADDKEDRAEQFFSGTLDAAARAALLAEVDYVFYGPLEADISGDPAAAMPAAVPTWSEGLILLDTLTDSTDTYLIFEVPRD